jgi:hypothetical protein
MWSPDHVIERRFVRVGINARILAKVIDEEKEDVGTLCGAGGRNRQSQQAEGENAFLHFVFFSSQGKASRPYSSSRPSKKHSNKTKP